MASLTPRLASHRATLGRDQQVPALVVVGLTLMAGAFGLDVVVHAAALEPVEPVAHGAGMLGMAITWIAVVADGLRRTARRA
jgi:hypothetical protein